MGSGISHFFVDVSTLPDGIGGTVQLLFLGFVYGYVLCYASNMIQNGSELWLLIPRLANTVGSVVLPVLGAVPEGAIVIFAGTGRDIQHKVSVGVGALAGSTIMLLTIPWALTILGARVDLDDEGNALYNSPGSPRQSLFSPRKKLTPGKFWNTGAIAGEHVRYLAKVNLVTLIPFLIIQIPAVASNCSMRANEKHCKANPTPALVGAILSTVLFVWYVWDQSRSTEGDEINTQVERAREDLLQKHIIDIEAIASPDSSTHVHTKSFQDYLQNFLTKLQKTSAQGGQLEKAELAVLLRNFSDRLEADGHRSSGFGNVNQPVQAEPLEPSDDEAEMPEDLLHLTPEQQQSRLLWRSLWMMSVGAALVILFTDPVVDFFNELGHRTNVKPFYIAFCFAPLASNASQIIPAYLYALKKTERTTTVALASLIGGAAVNNTFCLAVFLFLVYIQKLKWEFTAETITVLVIQIIMTFFAWKRTHHAWYAFVVLGFFPFALGMVAFLEKVVGLD